MYEIRANNKKLFDGTEITTFTRDVYNCNVLEAEAGTTGYQGDGSFRSGRTYIRIEDAGCTDISVRLLTDNFGTTGFEVVLCGDTELETMICALKFITKVLEDESKEVYD